MAVWRIVDVEDAQQYLVIADDEAEARGKYVDFKPRALLFAVERLYMYCPVGAKKIDVSGAQWLK